MDELGQWIVKTLESLQGFFLVIMLALWGGTVNYIDRRSKDKKKFSWAELMGEWTVSGFAGLLVALIGMEMQWSIYLVTFMSGMAGHMGGRALFVFEAFFKSRIGK